MKPFVTVIHSVLAWLPGATGIVLQRLPHN